MAVPYLTPQDVRDRYPSTLALGDPTKITDSMLAGLIAAFEAIVEEWRGVAYTPREATETIPVNTCGGSLLLDHGKVTEVTAIDYSGDSIEVPDPADVYTNGWSIDYPYGWPLGRRVTVTYTHGYAEPPALVLEACYEYVRAKALQLTSDKPRVQLPDQDNTGWTPAPPRPDAEHPTGIPAVDDMLIHLRDERVPDIA